MMVLPAIFLGLCLLLVLVQPATAAAVAICVFALEQWAQALHPYFTRQSWAINVYVGLLVVLGLVGLILRGQLRLRGYTATGWLALAVYGYALLSVLWAPRLDLSLTQWRLNAPYLVVFVFALPWLLAHSREVSRVLSATFWLGSLLAVMLLFGVEWQDRWIVLRGAVEGSVSNPLVPAQLGGDVAIIGLLGLGFRRGLGQFLLKSAVLLCALALIVRSGSRGQLFGLLLTLGLFWPLVSGRGGLERHVIWLVLLGVLGVVSHLAIDWYWGGSTRFSSSEISGAGAGRFDAGLRLLTVWSQSPGAILFGLGNSASFDPRIIGIYPHMVPVEVLGEEGLLGFGLYLACLVAGLREFTAARAEARDDPALAGDLTRLMALAFFSFLVALKQGSLLTNYPVFLFLLLISRTRQLAAAEHRVHAAQVGPVPDRHRPAKPWRQGFKPLADTERL